MNNIIPLLFFFLLFNQVLADVLPVHEPVPGGIAIVPLNTDKRPEAFYKDNQVMVIGESGAWKAIVGIGLGEKPGVHKIETRYNGLAMTYQFEVRNKEYANQHITIKDGRKVNPEPMDMERINKEKVLIEKAKTTWTDMDIVSLELAQPVEGPFSSPFGLRRFFNEQARRPHSGLDIAAPEGTPIKAPLSGRVVNTGNYFFNGNTIFIDHGQGFITMYCHLSETNVEQDQVVSKGDVIGKVGQTGRVTGAHLHWSVYLNKITVNPDLFLRTAK